MPRITVTLTDSVHNTIKEISDHTGDSVSEVCSTLIQKGLSAAHSEPIEDKITSTLDMIYEEIQGGFEAKISGVERLIERAIYVSLIAQKQATDLISKSMSDEQFKEHQEAVKEYANRALNAQIRAALGE